LQQFFKFWRNFHAKKKKDAGNSPLCAEKESFRFFL